MTKVQILIQGEGRTVLQEDGTSWPADGLEDPQTLFTRRRIADGDLIQAPDAPAAMATTGSKTTKSTEGEK